MSTMNDRFNIDDLYQEGIDIPRNPVDPVYVASESGWPDIEWGEIDAPDEVEEALAALGTQLHYIHVAQVLLLGEVMSGKTDINAKRLAILIAETRMRDVDAWGRYLTRVGKTGAIDETMKDYFERLHDDDVMVSRLIGTLLVDVLVTAIYENLNGMDKTLQRLIERNVGQAQRNINLSNHYLDAWIDMMPQDEQQAAAAQVDRYVTLKEQFIQNHATAFNTLGIDTGQVLDDFQTDAYTLHDRLHPE